MELTLLKTTTLPFIRDDLGVSSGYISESGDWVESPKTDPFNVEGNLQPFKAGNNVTRNGEYRKIEEQGYTADDARIFYTDAELFTTSQFSKRKADTTTIDTHTYIVFSKKDWAEYGLSLDHYEYILVREDQPTGE